MSAPASLIHFYSGLLDWLITAGCGAVVLVVLIRLLRRRRSQPLGDLEAEPPGLEVLVSPAAASFIREHGSNLYVWGAPVGDGSFVFIRCGTSPPDHEIAFRRQNAQSFTLNLEPGLWLGEWLEVKLRRFPFRRLTVDWETSSYGFGA